jgi:hypothetical protein
MGDLINERKGFVEVARLGDSTENHSKTRKKTSGRIQLRRTMERHGMRNWSGAERFAGLSRRSGYSGHRNSTALLNKAIVVLIKLGPVGKCLQESIWKVLLASTVSS